MDIDKLYLLARSLSYNGTIKIGSRLQRQVGYSLISRLRSPNGINYINDPTSTLTVSREELLAITGDLRSNVENRAIFVSTFNRLLGTISDSKKVGIAFDTTGIPDGDRRIKRFLRYLNMHSLTPDYIKNDPEALKNRVVSRLWDIILSPSVQKKAQTRVDNCTKELKDKAADSTSEDEKQISPDDPNSKFLMQVQAQLGRSVVGIGAVGLKSYFMLCTDNNLKVKNIRDLVIAGNINEAYSLLETLKVTNPLDNSTTSIAGTNFQPLLDLVKLGYIDINSEFASLLNQMATAVANVNIAEYLSAIVSLSADNMKDLALPKLNATEDLVDIYISALMVGIPFSQISGIMTSEVFNWLNDITQRNLYDSTTSTYGIKKLIPMLIGQPGNGGFNFYNLKKCINNFSNNKILKQTRSLGRLVSVLLNNPNLLTHTISLLQDKLYKSNVIEFSSDKTNPITVERKFEYIKLDNFLKILDEYRRRILMNPSIKENLKQLYKLLQSSEELNVLGRFGRINQGMSTDIYGLYNQIHQSEKFIDDKIKRIKSEKFIDDKVKRIKSEMFPDITTFEHFDFFKYLLDPAYREYWITKYEQYKSSINVLEALANSPHFFRMSQVLYYADTALRQTAAIYNKTTKIAKTLNSLDNVNLRDNDFKVLAKYIQDIVIASFLKDKSITIDGPIEIWVNTAKKENRTIHTIKLDSVTGIASFKHLMENTIVPQLKMDPKFKNNTFIQDLIIRGKDGERLALPIVMDSINYDPMAKENYNSYLRAFNSLADYQIYGHNICDLFFLYNLITNKNSFGSQSLTMIFEGLVNSTKSSKIVDSYYNFISNLDNGMSNLPTNTVEALYRLKTYSKGSTIKLGLSGLHSLDKDFTLDLPIFFNHDDEQTDVKHTFSTWDNLDTYSAIQTIINLCRTKYPGIKIEETCAEEFIELGMDPASKAAIKDGVIYMNVTVLNDKGGGNAFAVGVHEISHILLGVIKNNPTLKSKYYNLLKRIRNDSEYDTIAQLYPDVQGSDLDEEVLCNKMEKVMLGLLNKASKVDIELSDSKIIEKSLSDLFSINADLSPLDIGSVLLKMSRNLMMPKDIRNINVQAVKNNSKIAAIKDSLFKTTSDKENLKLNCND